MRRFSRFSVLARALTMAVAAAQIAIMAAAPVLDATADGACLTCAHGVSLVADHDGGSDHDPATCPVCALMQATPWLSTARAADFVASATVVAASPEGPVRAAARLAHHPRGPPVLS